MKTYAVPEEPRDAKEAAENACCAFCNAWHETGHEP